MENWTKAPHVLGEDAPPPDPPPSLGGGEQCVREQPRSFLQATSSGILQSKPAPIPYATQAPKSMPGIGLTVKRLLDRLRASLTMSFPKPQWLPSIRKAPPSKLLPAFTINFNKSPVSPLTYENLTPTIASILGSEAAQRMISHTSPRGKHLEVHLNTPDNSINSDLLNQAIEKLQENASLFLRFEPENGATKVRINTLEPAHHTVVVIRGIPAVWGRVNTSRVLFDVLKLPTNDLAQPPYVVRSPSKPTIPIVHLVYNKPPLQFVAWANAKEFKMTVGEITLTWDYAKPPGGYRKWCTNCLNPHPTDMCPVPPNTDLLPASCAVTTARPERSDYNGPIIIVKPIREWKELPRNDRGNLSTPGQPVNPDNGPPDQTQSTQSGRTGAKGPRTRRDDGSNQTPDCNLATTQSPTLQDPEPSTSSVAPANLLLNPLTTDPAVRLGRDTQFRRQRPRTNTGPLVTDRTLGSTQESTLCLETPDRMPNTGPTLIPATPEPCDKTPVPALTNEEPIPRGSAPEQEGDTSQNLAGAQPVVNLSKDRIPTSLSPQSGPIRLASPSNALPISQRISTPPIHRPRHTNVSDLLTNNAFRRLIQGSAAIHMTAQNPPLEIPGPTESEPPSRPTDLEQDPQTPEGLLCIENGQPIHDSSETRLEPSQLASSSPRPIRTPRARSQLKRGKSNPTRKAGHQ